MNRGKYLIPENINHFVERKFTKNKKAPLCKNVLFACLYVCNINFKPKLHVFKLTKNHNFFEKCI